MLIYNKYEHPQTRKIETEVLSIELWGQERRNDEHRLDAGKKICFCLWMEEYQ